MYISHKNQNLESLKKFLQYHSKFFDIFVFLKIFVNKNGIKSATPLKILNFEEKIS